jgi:hypothetical protein
VLLEEHGAKHVEKRHGGEDVVTGARCPHKTPAVAAVELQPGCAAIIISFRISFFCISWPLRPGLIRMGAARAAVFRRRWPVKKHTPKTHIRGHKSTAFTLRRIS